MKLEPRYLAQLAAVIEAGTLNEAAARLGTTQSALSRVIATLEKQIGAPLFERRKRPLIPTEIGRELADYGRTIKVITDQAATWAERLLAGDAGKFRIGAPPFLCDGLIDRMVAAYVNQHPATQITLSTYYLPELQTKLIDNRVDMIICPISLLDRSLDLQIDRLIDNENVIVCRTGHPLLTKHPLVEAADLEASTWITYTTGSALHADMLTALASVGIDGANFPFQSDSPASIITMLQYTDALTMLRRIGIIDHIANGKLAIVPFRLPVQNRTIGCAAKI